MEKLNLKQNMSEDKAYAVRVAKLIDSYAKLNENGRAKADEYLHRILTQIDDYICDLPINIKMDDNVVYVDFKKVGA